MPKAQNTYYNIVNDMDKIKVNTKPVSLTPVNKKPSLTSPAIDASMKNSMMYAIGIGMLAGLTISLITRKNFIGNILIGGAIGYAGDAFILKGKGGAKIKKIINPK